MNTTRNITGTDNFDEAASEEPFPADGTVLDIPPELYSNLKAFVSLKGVLSVKK